MAEVSERDSFGERKRKKSFVPMKEMKGGEKDWGTF